MNTRDTRASRPTSPPLGGAAGASAGPAPEDRPRHARLKPMRRFQGIAVSPGVAIGAALILEGGAASLSAPAGAWNALGSAPSPSRSIDLGRVTAELERLDQSLQAVHNEIKATEADARERLGPQYAEILAAHARMVLDPVLRREARKRIEQRLMAAEHAVREVIEDLASKLSGLRRATWPWMCGTSNSASCCN